VPPWRRRMGWTGGDPYKSSRVHRHGVYRTPRCCRILDGGSIKIFRGIVTMKPDDNTNPVVKPVMTHFFYMDETHPSKVRSWIGSVGPVQF
jgi:hypothetical protein